MKAAIIFNLKNVIIIFSNQQRAEKSLGEDCGVVWGGGWGVAGWIKKKKSKRLPKMQFHEAGNFKRLWGLVLITIPLGF